MSTEQLLSVNTFDADGIITDWQFNFAGVQPDVLSGTAPYLFPTDVKARELFTDEAGIPQVVERTGSLIQPNEFRIGGAPVAAGRKVQIYRSTEIRFPLVDYRDRQTVSELDLDLSSRQGLFVAMEVFDAAVIASESAQSAERVASEARALATEAVETANSANSTAGSALSTANSAVSTANAADAKADSAVETANQAAEDAAAVEALAAQAAADAAAAASSAEDAAADAATAVGVATAVDGKADTALANSTTALASATEALTTANAIDAKATTALADASEALTTANAIDSKAQLALDTANTATTTANSAASTAAGAVSVAASAQAAVTALDAEVVKAVEAGSGAGVSRTGNTVTVSMLAGVPLFSVLWWPNRAAVPAGYVVADGQTLSRVTYPDAWAGIGASNVPTVSDAAWLSTPTERGKYTAGDGSTTFRLPDYNGKAAGSLGAVFLRGDGALSAAVAGTIQASALQEHGHRIQGTPWNAGTGSGYIVSMVNPAYNTGDNTGTGAGPTYRDDFVKQVVGTTASTETRPLNATGCWVIRLFGAVVNPGSADAAQLATDLAAMSSALASVIAEIDFTIIYPFGTEASPGTIAANTRVVATNPFPGKTVIPIVQIKQPHNGGTAWGDPGWGGFNGNNPVGSRGLRVSQIGDELVLVAGGSYISGSIQDGNPFNPYNVNTSAQYRILVWKVGN